MPNHVFFKTNVNMMPSNMPLNRALLAAYFCKNLPDLARLPVCDPFFSGDMVAP